MCPQYPGRTRGNQLHRCSALSRPCTSDCHSSGESSDCPCLPCTRSSCPRSPLAIRPFQASPQIPTPRMLSSSLSSLSLPSSPSSAPQYHTAGPRSGGHSWKVQPHPQAPKYTPVCQLPTVQQPDREQKAINPESYSYQSPSDYAHTPTLRAATPHHWRLVPNADGETRPLSASDS